MSGSLESFAPRQELGGGGITQFNALQETKHQTVSEKHSMESLGSQEPGGGKVTQFNALQERKHLTVYKCHRVGKGRRVCNIFDCSHQGEQHCLQGPHQSCESSQPSYSLM